MKPRPVVLSVLFITIVCLPSGCKKESPSEPPLYVRSIELSVEDTSCTEAWLRVKLIGVVPPQTVQLKRLTPTPQTLQTVQLNTADSLLTDTALAPHSTYTYKAYRLSDSRLIDSSTALAVTTMDTTSHNWTFQIDTLGVTSSVLYDVAMVNDTLIYAVGEMYLRDSIGQIDPTPYNFARWNGTRWDIMRIQFYTICGQQSRTPYPASSIFAFNADDVWISSQGGQLARWNGTIQTATICNPYPFATYKIWGGNPNSIWAVGHGGRVDHYISGSWQRVASGTTLSVYGIYGVSSLTNSEVICVAGRLFVNQEKRVLRISPASIVALPDSGIQGTLYSIWFREGQKYYTVGDGIYEKFSVSTNTPWRSIHLGVTQYYTYGINGQALNDIVVCGSFGEVLHFNGVTWRSYQSVTGISAGAYYDVAIRGDLCIAVGYESPRAIVVVGRR